MCCEFLVVRPHVRSLVEQRNICSRMFHLMSTSSFKVKQGDVQELELIGAILKLKLS